MGFSQLSGNKACIDPEMNRHSSLYC